jgi:hypothetical protein
MQALRFANHPDANRLAENLDTHYRNANIRFSISDRLLNHVLPEIPSRSVPVRTTLLGSRVTGVSQIESDLRVRLLPSPNSWELKLETMGQVATRSVGRRGPAAVKTSSVNPFAASAPISVQPTDVEMGRVAVDVGGRAKLRGVETRYDSWPLIGALVRNIAENEYFDQASLSDRIARNRIRSQVAGQIDETLQTQIRSASARFSKTVLGPLTRLQLEPSVIDMQSTNDRLIARYRTAGDWQLAAMTPRPRALADNLFSVQIHQSALNNTLEQLVPQDRMLPINEVLRECLDVLGAGEVAIPEDIPADASVQFARHRPITVEIEDGKVWVTMRIIRFNRGSRLRLTNFIVRAAYVPAIDGLNAALVRDGHLSISGPGMSIRQRLPARAVFNKVLSPNRPIQLTSGELLQDHCPENCQITQFELRDGWIGVAVGRLAPHGRIAGRPAGIR